jgi:hypothetical protein
MLVCEQHHGTLKFGRSCHHRMTLGGYMCAFLEVLILAPLGRHNRRIKKLLSMAVVITPLQ